MKNKVVFGAIAILIVAVIASYLWRSNPIQKNDSTSKPTIKIGATLPLTGDLAYAGIPVQKAISLSFKDIQKSRDLKYNYELIFEDDAMDNKKAIINYQRLKNLNNISAILTMWNVSNVISQQTGKDQILHMGCSWGYEPGKGRYNFNHSTFPAEQVFTLIEEFKKRNIKKVGLLHNNDLVGQEIPDVLLHVLKENSIDLIFKKSFNTNERDFRLSIAQLKREDVDIVILLLQSPSMEIFMKQAKEMEYTPPLTGFDSFSYNPELFEGQWYIRDAIGTENFIKYFEEKTGENIIACASNLYDGLNILITGFEQTSLRNSRTIPDNNDVVDTILNMKSISNKTDSSYIDKEGNIHAEPQIEIIQNGLSVPLRK